LVLFDAPSTRTEYRRRTEGDIYSVELGFDELRSGLGEFVVVNDDFFASIKNEIRNKRTFD
jgi:hypothetical protein